MSLKVTKLYRLIDSHDLQGTIDFLDMHPDLLERNMGGLTIVHMACECDFAELIPVLINRGCSANDKDVNGYPPIYFPCSEGYTDVIKALLDNGADIEGLREIEEDETLFAV